MTTYHRSFNMLTQDQFKKALPAQMQNRISTDVMIRINDALSDPDTMEMMRENLLGYASVLRDGKFQMDQYISAVKYVSYKTMGDTNIAAYVKTFPDKYQDFLDRGIEPKVIARYNTAYNKSKLVNLVYEQSLIPTHIFNASVFQKAVNVQAELMTDPDVSAKVRSDAANSLMTHLKRPESQKIELDIAVKEDSAIADLRASTRALVEQQKTMLKTGAMNARDIAHSDLIIDVTPVEVL